MVLMLKKQSFQACGQRSFEAKLSSLRPAQL